jgi:DNA-binding protein HU-beta
MATKPAKKIKKVAKKPAVKKAAPAKKVTKPAKKAAPAKTVKASSGDSGQKSRSLLKPRSTAGTYTQTEFLENIKAFCGLEKRSQAKELTEDLADLIKDTLKKGYKIPFFGLGKLYVRESKARIGRNPQTGAEMKIPAKKRVRFAPAKALKDAVL